MGETALRPRGRLRVGVTRQIHVREDIHGLGLEIITVILRHVGQTIIRGSIQRNDRVIILNDISFLLVGDTLALGGEKERRGGIRSIGRPTYFRVYIHMGTKEGDV